MTTHTLPGGLTVTVRPEPAPAVIVPLAELIALRRTVAELVALLEAAEAGPGARMSLRSMQGMGRSVAARLASFQ